jgi:hypothetical protein
MAQGRGEYLTAMATLLDVPADHHAEFFRFAQESYPLVFNERTPAIESVNRLIRQLSESPLRRSTSLAS